MSCPDCFRGGKALGEPKGQIQALHQVQTYVATPPNPHPSGSTIVYFPDIFGLGFLNNKVLADAYAVATGFRVLIPDLIPGGGAEPTLLPLFDKAFEDVAFFNIPGQLSRAFNFVRALLTAVPIMYRSKASSPECFGSCLEYARNVKASLPPGAKLGTTGFCWGGYPSLNLCAQPAVQGGAERLIDAQFCAHPSRLKLPDDVVNAMTAFKTPLSFALAEKDPGLSTAQAGQMEAALKDKVGKGEGDGGHYYELKIYKGASHGFAVRAKPGSEVEANAADEALEQAVEWFKRWL